MNLIHKRIVLRQGSVIRVIGTRRLYIDSHIFQYIVDMLWPDNNWQRIYVSKIYYDVWTLMLHIDKYCVKSANSFNMRYLVKENRKRYGKEIKVNPPV